MAIEINSESAICSKCGKRYGRHKGYFPVSYSELHKGIGYIPVCKECIDTMYNKYLSQCEDAKMAVRQMCRKLDLYWSESVYDVVMRKSSTRSMMTQYIAKINTVTYAGKSYDDTLSNEGTLWSFATNNGKTSTTDTHIEDRVVDDIDAVDGDDEAIPENVIAFWGSGYKPNMYRELENRFQYWKSRLPDDFKMDIGTEAIIRQICSLELDINRDRAAGRQTDKSVATINTLLGSLNLKPTQRRDDADSSIDGTPFGVWIRRFETQRPIPEPDPELKDVDGIVRYISTWFLGHVCKMLGIKNTYCKMYDDAIAKIRVDRPEYEGEDDETMFNDIFGSDEEDEEDIE